MEPRLWKEPQQARSLCYTGVGKGTWKQEKVGVSVEGWQVHQRSEGYPSLSLSFYHPPKPLSKDFPFSSLREGLGACTRHLTTLAAFALDGALWPGLPAVCPSRDILPGVASPCVWSDQHIAGEQGLPSGC